MSTIPTRLFLTELHPKTTHEIFSFIHTTKWFNWIRYNRKLQSVYYIKPSSYRALHLSKQLSSTTPSMILCDAFIQKCTETAQFVDNQEWNYALMFCVFNVLTPDSKLYCHINHPELFGLFSWMSDKFNYKINWKINMNDVKSNIATTCSLSVSREKLEQFLTTNNRNIRSLTINNINSLDHDLFTMSNGNNSPSCLLSRLNSLERLTIEKTNFKHLNHCLLQLLNLENVKVIEWFIVKFLLSSFERFVKHLRESKLWKCQWLFKGCHIDDNNVLYWCTSGLRPEVLGLSQNNITGKALVHWIDSPITNDIKEWNLENNPKWNHDFIPLCWTEKLRLSTLTLKNININSYISYILEWKNPYWRSLGLSRCDISDNNLQGVKPENIGVSSLREIVIDYNDQLKEEGISFFINNFPVLESLSMRKIWWNDTVINNVMDRVTKGSRITYWGIANNCITSKGGISLLKKGVFEKWKVLDIGGNWIDDVFIEYWIKMKNENENERLNSWVDVGIEGNGNVCEVWKKELYKWYCKLNGYLSDV